MLDLQKYDYQLQVGVVFSTFPRLGTEANAIWISRTAEQEHFDSYFHVEGLHIVVDGPTGTGKTSLALTSLANMRVPHAAVTVTDGMTWPQFCSASSQLRRDQGRSTEHQVTAGIDKGFPILLYRGTSGKNTPSATEVQEWANAVTVQGLADLIRQANVPLMIDDAENISNELLVQIANLAKLLVTERTESTRAKLIIVGTGDICRRLYLAKKPLEERLGEIPLGTFPDKGESWNFLRRGFDLLQRRHPGNTKLQGEKTALPRAIESIYDAADGLPKALNSLGRDVALEARNRDISAAGLVAVAKQRAQDNWRRYMRECRDLLSAIHSNAITQEIIKHLYSRGVGRIHDSDDIHRSLDKSLGSSQIEQALTDLQEHGFLTRTGITNRVVFVQSPSLAHTLGVVMASPRLYEGAVNLFAKTEGQLWLLAPPADP